MEDCSNHCTRVHVHVHTCSMMKSDLCCIFFVRDWGFLSNQSGTKITIVLLGIRGSLEGWGGGMGEGTRVGMVTPLFGRHDA